MAHVSKGYKSEIFGELGFIQKYDKEKKLWKELTERKKLKSCELENRRKKLLNWCHSRE